MSYSKNFSRKQKKTKRNQRILMTKDVDIRQTSPNKTNVFFRPTTNWYNNRLLSTMSVLYVLVITAVGLIGFYLPSIQIYWRQTYHAEISLNDSLLSSEAQTQNDNSEISPEALLNEIIEKYQPALREKQITSDTLHKKRTKRDNEVTSKETIIHPPAPHKAVSQVEINKKRSNQALPDKQALVEPVEEVKVPTKPVQPQQIVLTNNSKVFFAGDSMMQGVAPFVKKMLFKQYKLESIDASKQSTGLTYPSAFDWPKKIQETLEQEPKIKLLVMFLGPNDPWDFPIKGQNKYTKFKSELWEQEYRSRIETILNTAASHNVEVLWLAAPCMRKAKLNDGMIYLNSLYQSELNKANQHFLTTNDLLGCTYEQFNNFIESDKEKIKVRIDDGIHFTPKGQQILAKAIMREIIFKDLEEQNRD